ncbi:ribonuclease H-like domain-containing protein [Tanacetum coccineum]
MGDFNVTLRSHEHSSGTSNMNGGMIKFNECVNNLEVEDICSLGFKFTWTKSLKNPKSSIMKKLDRIMVNEDFIQQYQNAFGVFHPFMIFDHSPTVVTIPNGLKKKRKAFRFMNYIADKKEFIECVESEWNHEIKGCNMYKVVQKLKRLKKPLNKLNWMNGNLTEKVARLKKKLKEIQADVEKNPFDYDLKEKAAHVLNEYMEASNDELKLLQQKAKIKWYDGDKVAEAFVDHFKKFLGTKYVVQPLSSVDITFGKTLSEEEANEMIRMVSDKEIKEAVFDIDSNKASGPNGYTSGFFKKAWNSISKEVCLAVKDFFRNGKILGEINARMIALIPKVEEGTQDNILIAQELLKGYKRKNGVRRCALNIDIQKAYDTVFSFLLHQNIQSVRKFKYHYRCKDIQLSNMCFADDLLVLCNGDVESIGAVKKLMDQFSSISGLFPNLGKSTIFFGSVPLKVQEDILQIMPLQVGSLPMRYLGVPLIAKKLSANDCRSLVEKVAEKINRWRNKMLTYVGIIQLIASVLSSMQIYWASVYMLPDSTIKEDQGGLVIKDLKKWNEILLIKQLWKIIEGKDSLWVKWVNVAKLKGTSIWDIKSNHNDSCGWKKLLDLRSRVKNHVFYNVGNGKNIYVWFDRWDINGPLYNIIPRRVCWKQRFPVLDSINVPQISNGVNDKVLWLNNQSKKKEFSTKQAWWDLRDNAARVEWYNANCVTNPECLLYKKERDSHSYLFFKCDYSKELWGKIKNKLVNMIDQDDLRTIVNHIAKSQAKKNLWKIVNRVVIAAITAKQLAAKRNQERVKSILLLAIPDEYLLKFHNVPDAKSLWAAIKSRFGGNEESKKMQKNVLKHQFKIFVVASNESLDKAYDMFQKLIIQLEVHGAPILKEDINQKFLRSLPSSWNQIALIMRNKPGIDEIDIDDLYNNLRVYEDEMKKSSSSTSNSQNLAFLSSENTNSTNEVSTASGDIGVSTAGGTSQVPSTSYAHDIDGDDLEELDLRWQVAMLTVRVKKKGHFARDCRSGRNQGRRSYGDNGRSNAPTNESSSQALVAQDGLGGYDWSNDFEVEPVNYALMAISSSSSSSSSDSEEDSSKNLDEILNSQMSARDKTGLGYDTQLNELSRNHETDSENSFSIFDVRSSDEEFTPANDRSSKAYGYHDVPPPITGNFLTPRADISFIGLDKCAIRNKIIESQTTELNTKTSETAGKTNDANTEKPKSASESVVSNPKINKDRVIIEDWNSYDEEEVYEVQIVRPETQTVKTRDDKSGRNSQKQGISFRKVKACFICKSTDHLIKDCNFHDKKSQEPKLKNVVNNGQRDGKPVWDNTKRVNHQNFSKYPHLSNIFVPLGVLTRTGLHRPSVSTARHVCTARPSVSTARPVCTARPSVSTARPVCTARPSVSTARPVYATRPIYPRMDNVRPRGSCSPIKRSYYTKPAFRPKDLKQDVKTFGVQNMTTAGTRAVVNTGKGKLDTDLKKSRWVWRPKGNYLDHVSKDSGSFMLKKGNPEILLQDHAVVDSGCSSHMTGNKAYLSDYEDFNGGFVAFGSDPKGGKITGKGKIKTANLDFDDVYFVDELKFNLFSVSQMCDKKNSVLFTESECLILSPSFKLLDESQVVLRAPRKDDVYSLDLKNIVPSGGITCLYANATAAESKLKHRRLGHVNFKNINKLVKGHLVRGLPSKVFVNDHTCVACKKGKQHKASCKAKLERIIRKPLELLHMDLFRPVSVESINKKRYLKHQPKLGLWYPIDSLLQLEACSDSDYAGAILDRKLTTEYVAAAHCCGQNESTICVVKNPVYHSRTKHIEIRHHFIFDGKSDEGYLLGYFTTSKAFRVYNKRTKRVEENLHINFLEDQLNVTGTGLNWMFDLDFLTNSMNYIPVSVENQVLWNVVHKILIVALKDVALPAHEKPSESSPKDNDVQDSEDVADKEEQHQMKESEQDLQDELEKMVTQELAAKAMDDVSRQAFEEEKRIIASQKKAAQATRKIPIGCIYFLPTNVDLPIDPNMPDLEDASDTLPNDGLFNGAYDDDEDVGAVANFNNMDNTITVSPIPTLRIHKDHPKGQILGDPTSVVQIRGKIQKASSSQQALVRYIHKQNKTNHKDHQNCLFACFLSQEEPKTISQALQDESWVKAMQEELLQFKLQKVWVLVDLPYGKKEEGIYYDEVFAPVTRIKAIRGWCLYITSRYVDPAHPNKVYKVIKALYGLHQAPRACYEKLSSFLMENGFRRGTIDKTLFIKKKKSDIMLVQVYVDDIIFGSTKKSMCTEFEDCMHKRFQMSSMGELTFFLGLQVKQQPDGIFISQDKYVADIFKKFDFLSIRIATTPIESNKPLVKDEMVSLISITLNAVKDFLVTMKEPALTENQHCGCQFLGRRLISWQCKKQTIVANSTTEAEYVAAANCYGYLGSRESLERDMDGTAEFLLSNLFDFWLTKVSIDRLKVNTDRQSLYRYKSVRENTVVGKPVTISEASIRSDLLFDDADGIDSLNNQAIFDNIQLMGNQLKDVPVPLDHFPVPTLTKKVLTFMVKKEDGVRLQKDNLIPQPLPSPPSPSADQPQTQTDPSPRPSSSIAIPDSNPEGSGGNHGGQSSNDTSLSGNEDGLTLQSIKKLKKKAKPVITHHKAWMKSVALKTRLARKTSLKKTGYKRDPAFDDLDDDAMDYMETEDAQDEGRTSSVVLEEKESADKEVSTGAPVRTVKANKGTAKRNEGTNKQDGGTDSTKVSTNRQDEGIADQNEGKSATQTTLTPTLTIFGNDETIAQVLITMSQNKQKDKEKGVEIRNVEDTERPRPTSTRSVLTLKPLPKIDLKDKGKKMIDKEGESNTESDDITKAEKKFKMLGKEGKLKRKRLVEEEATKVALTNEYDFIQARINTNKILAEELQKEEREKFTIEQRAKFLHDTIDAQRKFLAQQRLKRQDQNFVAIGSAKDERQIKELNKDPKRIGLSMKLQDSEFMETKSFITRLHKVSSPYGNYLVVYRVNGHFRAFNYLMEVLHFFDRQDLFHLYDLVMKQYSEITPEDIELILWGDLKIMMESSIEENDQELKDGTVIYMLVERRYPLSKELLQRMLDLGLEVEEESTTALQLGWAGMVRSEMVEESLRELCKQDSFGLSSIWVSLRVLGVEDELLLGDFGGGGMEREGIARDRLVDSRYCRAITSKSIELPFSPATKPGYPGRLVAGDAFPGRHVARDKLSGKARRGYIFTERLNPGDNTGRHVVSSTIKCHRRRVIPGDKSPG